ncbi:hypothetical protein H4582DRAFT_2079181 [Lactarius indigo]|nr:hypothetical protein H4582DRAFT_2079181 [Lactarius indigo]
MSKIRTPLDQALAAGFTHNSTSPNMMASASAVVAAATRRSAKETRAESSSDSASVEVVIPLPTKRARTQARAQAQTSGTKMTLTTPKMRSSSMHRGNYAAYPRPSINHSLYPTPAETQARRSAQKHRASTPPPIHTPMSISTSTPEPTPPPQEKSSPIMLAGINSLAGLLLTVLPELARTEIAIPPRAFSHVHSSSQSSRPPDPDDLRDASLDLDLNLDIYMDLEAGLADTDADADAHGVVDDNVPLHLPPSLLHTAGIHDHPDGPMLDFVIPEHDSVDHSPGVGVDVGHALTSPSLGLNFDLASPNRGAEGRIDWRAGNVFGAAGTSTDSSVGEYAGDGTIDPSVLGGSSGDLSPEKLVDDVSSPVRGFGGVQPSGG